MSQSEIKVSTSEVLSVKIYSSGALVVRKFNATVQPGINRIVVSGTCLRDRVREH
ncbi:MAG: hypothetical protein IPO27_14750 [Bacteroidetes bacterium]|nr:hypothetical protein [Bacteroidota bacterium]